jgi:hypothetical protein
MATTRAMQALQQAISNLETFANEPGCEWCKDKADELRKAAEELQEVLPIAEEMKQKVDVLARQNITSTRREILDAKDTLVSTDPNELAGSPLLRQAGRRESNPPANASPKPMDPALSSPSVFDRQTFKEAAEFFQVRPMIREMVSGMRGKGKDRFTLSGLFD